MKDKMVMENLLLLLKGTCEVYVHGTQEASNKKIHDILENCLNELLKMQYEVYNKMVEFEWYTTENIKPNEIIKTIKKLASK